MDEISKITSALTGGALPEGYNPKVIEKLSKRFQKLSEARIIRTIPFVASAMTRTSTASTPSPSRARR